MKCRALPTQRGLLLFLPLSDCVTTTLSNTGKLLCESSLIQSLFCPPLRNWNGLGLRLAGPLPRTWWRHGRDTLPEADETSFPQELPTSVQFTSSSGPDRHERTERKREPTYPPTNSGTWPRVKRKSFAARGRTFSVEPFHFFFFWTSICWEVCVCAPRSGWGICGCCSSSVWWPPGSPRRWVSVFSLYQRVNRRGAGDNSTFLSQKTRDLLFWFTSCEEQLSSGAFKAHENKEPPLVGVFFFLPFCLV